MAAGRPWVSVMSTNFAIVGRGRSPGGRSWGCATFFLVHAPISLLTSSAGVWLFYVQHQFEHTYWAWGADWNVHTGALHGSSHYDLPPVLRWFTANIGIHHVHHLLQPDPLLPAGRGAARASPGLRAVSRLTLEGELPVPKSRAVGRGPAATGGVPRCPRVAGVRTPKRSGSRFVIGVARGRRLSDRSSGTFEERLRADG